MPALFSCGTKSLPPMAKNILLISEVQTELDEKKNCEKNITTIPQGYRDPPVVEKMSDYVEPCVLLL